MHRRVSLSAISTVSWALDEDLDFYADAGITNVGVSVAKLDRFGWDEGIRRVVDAGLRVTNLIGLGPFDLARPERWESQRERLGRALDAAAAPVLVDARGRGLPFALEHTNSLRVDVSFVHTLRDVLDLARRLDTDVCMELNAC